MCCNNIVKVCTHDTGTQQSISLWFFRHGKCRSTPFNVVGFGMCFNFIASDSLPSAKTNRTPDLLIVHSSPDRINDTKPSATINAVCLFHQLPAFPYLFTISLTIVRVMPADCFLVKGCAASAPSTIADIVGFSLSEVQPRFARSADNTILADLGRVGPLFSVATCAIKCLHITSDRKHCSAERRTPDLSHICCEKT